MNVLGGTPIYKDLLLCPAPIPLRPRRPHRRPRIQKKWIKRFGYVYAPCPGKAYNIGGTYHLCPHAYDALIEKCKPGDFE